MKTLIQITLAAVMIAAGTPLEAHDWGGHFYHRHYSSPYCYPYHSTGYFRVGVFGWPSYYRPYYYSYSPRYYGTRYYVEDSMYSLGADVQLELSRRGYYHGAIDGVIGPQSRTAISRYQANRGLPVTGRIDEYLLRSLGLD